MGSRVGAAPPALLSSKALQSRRPGGAPRTKAVNADADGAGRDGRAVRVDDVDELGLERGAAHEEAVNVGLRGQLLGVAARHAAAVDDARRGARRRRDVAVQPAAQLGVHLLRLRRRRHLARADRPHRLVGHDNLAPVLDHARVGLRGAERINGMRVGGGRRWRASVSGRGCARCAMGTLAAARRRRRRPRTASWLVTTSMVRPASRSASVSPRHAMTVRPLSMAAVVLAAMSSFVSPFWRRSLWPRMAYLRPRSLSIEALTSPVCAPVEAKASCEATAKSRRRRARTSAR